jgi:hypothetical protein
MLPAELSGVLEERTATRWRLQYDSWLMVRAAAITLAMPSGVPAGSLRVPVWWKSTLNQSAHHSQTFRRR